MIILKSFSKKILGERNLRRIRTLVNSKLIRNIRTKIALTRSFLMDLKLYRKHSSVLKKDTYNKIESEITLRYHSIEKGFLHNPIRYRFAKIRVEELIAYLKHKDVSNHLYDTHIQSAILNLCFYYEIHLDASVDITDYFLQEEYEQLKKHLTIDYQPVKYHTSKEYFKYKQSDFRQFSISRCSVRDFAEEYISIDTLQNVVDLANHAPSVCNRQGISVVLLENKQIINEILKIQGGLKGYSENLSQLIVLISDRNYFYSIGERYQLYIDGGIYLMNLLYALHYYEIAACPAHWGLPIESDIEAQQIIGLKESEKIVCLIAIGKPTSEFNTTLSLRRTYTENFRVMN